MKDLLVARISPPGRGAIGVLWLGGSSAAEALGRFFRPRAARAWDEVRDRAIYGDFLDSRGEVLDNGFVLPLSGPDSPEYLATLHGNPILLEAFVEALVDAGATRLAPSVSAWTGVRRNSVRREALDLLPRARSREATAFLLEQGEGPRGLAGWVEELGRRPAAAASAAGSEIAEALARGSAARGLFEPRRVVLAGPPNAGKSSLFNRLLGARRVVTHADAGTTRDLIEEEALIGAYPIRLVDGAGLRRTTDRIEREGVRRMEEAMSEADLVVYLIPPRGVGASEEETAPPNSAFTLNILSRADQITRVPDGYGSLLEVSATTGAGVSALRQSILLRLFGDTEPPRGPSPFLERHERLLRGALRLSAAGCDPRPCLRELAAEPARNGEEGWG